MAERAPYYACLTVKIAEFVFNCTLNLLFSDEKKFSSIKIS